MTADMSDVYAEAAAALVATFRIGSSAAAGGGAEYTTTAWFRAAVDVAYGRGLADAKVDRAAEIDALTRGAHEDGKGDGRAEGRRQATEAVRAQANLPDLVHFDRPSDFRKGVLTCLAALEAAEGKPDA